MLKQTIAALLALTVLGGAAQASPGSRIAKDPSGAPSYQTRSATGVVRDASGPVIGAGVIIKGTAKGVITDMDGAFDLPDVHLGSILEISCVGYVTRTAVWTGQPLDILLEEDSELLEGIVVVGFGTQKKVNLTGSVSTVSAKDIASRPVNSVVDALQGMVPGMNVAAGSGGGALNSSRTFNIRGRGTIGSGSSVTPLILIDGMEGDINTLNPQDIENLSVLKDASASSIYGSRAAGGVVLITTKKGKAGKAVINYNNNFRFSSPLNMPEMMDSYSWALYMNTASIYSGNGVWFTEDKLAQILAAQKDPSLPTMFANGNNQWEIWDNTPLLPVGNTDWFKEHFGNSFTQEHNFSASGGSETMQYYFSANYLDQGGTLRHGDDNQQRYTVNGKINAKLAKWANLSYATRFTRTDFTTPTVAYSESSFPQFYHDAARYWPILPVKDPNGYYVTESYIEELENGGQVKQQTDVMAQQFALQLTPLAGWIINAELNYRTTTQYRHRDWITTYGWDVDGNPFVFHNPNNAVQEYTAKTNYVNPNIFSEYSRELAGGHNFKVMAGFQAELLKNRSITGQKYGIMAGLPTLNTTTSNPSASGAYNSWATAGWFGRLNYDYNGRYLFEANVRYDGSSRFIGDARWGFFPSFSMGWNIAKESFMENVSWVDMLKLRGSWGELGNQNTDNWYPFYPSVGFTSQGGNWLTGTAQKPNVSSQPSLVSTSLTWEKSRTWEIGLDWGLLNNRLTGTFGYYQRKTYDMVGPAPELPDVLGAAVPRVNNLDMTSKGWDLQISWRDYIDEFSYGATLSLSDNKVVIDKYPNEAYNLDNYYVGAVLGDIWGLTTVGIAKTQEEMDAHLAKVDQSLLGSNWSAGDIMYADIDGNGAIDDGTWTLGDSGDFQVIGNSTPRYNFGLNLEAAWKGFDLKVFFQGTLKRDYAAGGAFFWGTVGQGKWQALGFKEHEDYFRDDPNDPKGLNLDSYYPRPNWGGGRNTYTQTRYLQNAAYARLKNVTLGYTVPQNFTQKFGVNNFRAFVSLENLLTITKFTGLSDPELIDANMNWGFGKAYPLSKTVSFGVSLTF